ncbi:MAG: hypothetical protein ACJ790_01605 [Myxococcaceae bacterium]
MSALLPVVGVVLIGAALYDIFHTLFHPMGHGSLSGFVMKAVWKLSRALAKHYHRIISIAGAMLFGSAILLWSTMLWLGFALIFTPLNHSAGSTDAPPFVDALYRSACFLTTFSAEVPFEHAHPWARLLVPLESAFGLMVATASISWVMAMQPILRHRRGFAHGMRAVFDAMDDEGGVSQVPASELADALGRIARELLQIRSDLRHTPGAYYFHAEDEQMSVPAILPRLLEFARAAMERPEPEVRIRARMLLRSLDNLAATVRENYLEDAPKYERPEKTVARWRRDHLKA